MKRDAEVDRWVEVVRIVTHHDVSVVTQGGEPLVIEASINISGERNRPGSRFLAVGAVVRRAVIEWMATTIPRSQMADWCKSAVAPIPELVVVAGDWKPWLGNQEMEG